MEQSLVLTDLPVQTHNRARVLSVFSLVMITVTSVDSVRNLPTTALFGTQLITFFIVASIIFLIPTALVSAELATALPQQGGVYVWVKNAFGERFGFLAIWFQWIENVFWYPAILSFIAGSLAYLVAPHLADSKYYIITVILVFFWGATILNLFGMKVSAWFSAFCGIIGLIIPMLLIITLGAIWVFTKHPLQINFSWQALSPKFHDPTMLVAFTGIILSFCGMEITTVYAGEVTNPQRDYPKALLISTIILLSTLVLGALAIAVVIPHDHISLVAGLMQAFSNFFAAYNLNYLVPVLAIMIIIGGVGSLSNWIIAPSKGLLIAAEDGNLPAVLAKENKYGAPTLILIFQAIVTTIISMVFLLMPEVNASYWILTALAAQLYMIMYILMFAAGIYLSFKRTDLSRTFRIPGGKMGMLLVAGIGIAACLFTFIIGFVPPADINVGSTTRYEVILSVGLVLMCVIPFFISKK